MPGFPAPFIKFREDDNNGKPLAGGKLFSYAAGTSTPLSTFFNQDLAPGHENTNPVILDASGRADIWLGAGVGYKFILTDALGNQIWTQDNVSIPAPGSTSSGDGGGGGGGETVDPTFLVPTGAVLPFAGSTAPTGYLLCNGQSVSQSLYPNLYAAIGTTYGSGTGGTSFNVPNLKQRFPLGKADGGTGATLGGIGGEVDHRHDGDSHQHSLTDHWHTFNHTHSANLSVQNQFGSGGSFGAYPTGAVTTGGPNEGVNTSGVTNTTPGATPFLTNFAGGGKTSANNPPFLVLNFIIKT